MNVQHFKTFLWLRWRIRVNQFRKAGSLNFAFFVIIAVFAAFAAVGMSISGFFIGWLALPQAPPPVRLFVWDGIVAAFLFFWTIGLLTDLQRSESLALDKFLHLPVSLSGAFLINYLSSLFSLTLIVFVPGLIGLIIGQALAHGVVMLLAFPLIAAAVFAITALTYQFQGWLASLMANPRRRRTVVVMVTAGLILVAQLPNLFNIMRPRKFDDSSWKQQIEEESELMKQMSAKKVKPKEYQQRLEESRRLRDERRKEESREQLERAGDQAWLISAVLPPGWVAIGAADLTVGRVWPALLGTLGLTLIGAASFRRAYRTTIRLYTGQFSAKAGRTAAPTATVRRAPTDKPVFIEWRLPRVSEQASAVAVAAFRSTMRAPEAKMSMLAPIIMAVVFGGIAMSTDERPLAVARPFFLYAASVGVMLLAGLQLIGNQFGYDRAGFRAYVLSPMPRREILLGKNLAIAPLAIGLGLTGIIVVGAVYPTRIDHYPAAVLQIITTYVMFCIVANVLSILAPMAMKAGSIQASNVKIVPVLIQMTFLMFLPFVMLPAAVPIGVEALLEQTDVIRGVPIALPLSVLGLSLALVLYRALIGVEGEWLQAREKKILEVVGSTQE